ncbi:MAG: hypothetical protein P8L70_10810 [Halioglobus sp.]|nr:hypothetical protein [Halioglobus sp.]MDG2327207.1 hypothetical protein [Halioglobus sp.]
MRNFSVSQRQRGVITIFISMIMLLLITLLIATAFRLSTTNLRAVGNVQTRSEAISAAENVIEQILVEDAGLSAFQTARTENVDINQDTVDDYLVTVPAPLCVRATRANVTTASSVTLPGFSASGAWNTVWEITAIATDVASGTSVSVVHAIRFLLTDTEKNAVCA